MVEVTPGHLLVKMEEITPRDRNGIIMVNAKKKYKRNFGEILQSKSDKLKVGSKILFFAQSGVIMEGKCLISEKDVTGIIKQKEMQLLGERILFKPELSSDKIGEKVKLIVGDAQRKYMPIGEVISIGDEVTKVKVGDRILVPNDRTQDLSAYLEEVYPGELIHSVRQGDIIMVY